MNPFYRQNDREALRYLKASYRCLTKERNVKYFVIICSVLVCLSGIFNKYLPIMFNRVANITTIQQQVSTYINLASGVVIILSMCMSFYTHRMHVEGICLQERFDCYTFEAPLNQAITRPISQTIIEVYDSKVKARADKFYNIYYSSPDEVKENTAHFDNINRQFHSDYRLYVSVQPFFLTIWVGFCLAIFIMAVGFNDDFINTLINILFPSLSAISIIGNSWYNFRQQLRQMQTAMTVIDAIQTLPDAERKRKMMDITVLRMLQDSLFNFRLSPFVIPNFLIKHHEKIMARESWGNEMRSSDLVIAMQGKKNRHKGYKELKAVVKSEGDITLPQIKTIYLPKITDSDDMSNTQSNTKIVTAKPITSPRQRTTKNALPRANSSIANGNPNDPSIEVVKNALAKATNRSDSKIEVTPNIEVAATDTSKRRATKSNSNSKITPNDEVAATNVSVATNASRRTPKK